MVTGATSLSLVRDELFATIAEAEQSLEHFIADRNNGSLLQQAVEALHQIRGTLNLIELTGAELLAQELMRSATDVPVAAGADHDSQLAALTSGLYVLLHYLESVDASRQEMPELLLPAINSLRKASGQAPLPDSFFFSVRADQARPNPPSKASADASALYEESRRLRHMYQVGLLGFIREDKSAPSLKLMHRAMTRLDGLYGASSRGHLCWVAAAALEAQQDAQLLPRASRKLLFGRLDRELKQMFANSDYQAPRPVLKELLYLVALADTKGPQVSEVRQAFALASLPFTDHLLQEEAERLAGPGEAVMRSLSTAIQEELALIKDLLDLIERGTATDEAYPNLHQQIGKLAKTLIMVGMPAAASALQNQLSAISTWTAQNRPTLQAMQKLADSVLYVEGLVPDLGRAEARRVKGREDSSNTEEKSFAQHQLNEARIVVLEEALGGLALAKRAITAYVESNGEKLHLANVPFTLQSIRGGLWFLGQERIAALIDACAQYIQRAMLEGAQMPAQQMLETLADAMTSLEYYLEGSSRPGDDKARANVLDLAEESVRALGMPVAA